MNPTCPTSPFDTEAPLPSALVTVRPTRLGGPAREDEEWVAEEVPVALEYNGLSQAVMLATPLDLEDFALGFSLSEGLIATPADLLDIEIQTRPNGVALQLRVTARCELLLKERRRSMAGRTGCGLCGTDNLDQVFRPPAQPVPALPVDRSQLIPVLSRAMRELAEAQPLQQRSGGIHAAAWCGPDGAVRLVREDVGRHNALDKLIGALARAGTDTAAGFAAVTSRASFEMVQKAAGAGMPMLAAVSAPTHLAIRTAQACGLTLAGFVREGRATLYS
ncbi:formate dehydrogenase accessory sulfurtransferase FdhD [Roseateles amylovorans]|uniref:Sulfur carrier protein FdhD n=1 Tax=Roseateles amylovorans TaxID=2978473 RepID=A0ABY6B7N4_9BURK|nr:formate dehydrogenase accessory sulfurtransferase FdhD [Roseateles amylovorans]UXH79221.1 formate dehydrogenase accessory sulfurtransferase FdhD [Roseateles amylovorans]